MKTLLVTLSGTHGTGKSTHAGRCYYLLNNNGYKFAYIRHQDLIDPFGFLLRRSAKILGFQQTNQLERMKPVRVLWSLYILLVYLPFLAGGISLRRRFGYSVVTDRYFYDFVVAFWGQKVHVPMEHILAWVIPRPDVSFVLDADEQRILRERPEHSADFIRNEKELYGKVAKWFGIERIRTTEDTQKVWKHMVDEIEATFHSPQTKNKQS